MTVLRITTNIAAPRESLIADVQRFYSDLLGLRSAMDHGWIVTLAGDGRGPVQLSIASEGGSGTAVPDLSIEVDDLDAVIAKAEAMQVPLEYGPVSEPWGVRRIYLRDPLGKVLNILTHI